MGTFSGKTTLVIFILASLVNRVNSLVKNLLPEEQILYFESRALSQKSILPNIANRKSRNLFLLEEKKAEKHDILIYQKALASCASFLWVRLKFSIFTNGNNFYDFVFFLDDEVLPKRGLLLMLLQEHVTCKS